MAGSYLYKNKSDGVNYVRNILRTTITKDIVKKYKKEIPFMPKVIGVLTSQTGSVIRDIINDTTPEPIKVEEIIFQVSKTFNVSEKDIISKRKTAAEDIRSARAKVK